MDKAIIYTHELGKVYAHAPGELMPQKRKHWPRWSLGVRSVNFILASGQPGVDRTGNVLAYDDALEQSRYALDNGRKIVEAGGGHFQDVFKVRVFLDYPEDYEAVTRGVERYLEEQFPDGRLPAFSHLLAEGSSGLMRAEIEVFAATEHESIRSEALYPGPAPGFPWRNYAHATRVGNIYFLSGQLPIDPHGGLVGETATAQTRQALGNLATALDACGIGPKDIVKLTTWIDRAEDAPAVREEVGRFLRDAFAGEAYPAGTCLIAPLVLEGIRVQIEAIAATGEKQVVRAPAAYDRLPDGMPYSPAVKVAIQSQEGSYLRRFTWPSYPLDVDRSKIGAHLEILHPLGHLVFLSAQAPLDPSGRLVEGGIAEQASRVFSNMKGIAEAAGGRFSDIAQVDLYFAHRQYYEGFNEVRIRFLEEHYPDKDWFCGSGPTALSCIPGALVEVESIATVA